MDHLLVARRVGELEAGQPKGLDPGAILGTRDQKDGLGQIRAQSTDPRLERRDPLRPHTSLPQERLGRHNQALERLGRKPGETRTQGSLDEHGHAAILPGLVDRRASLRAGIDHEHSKARIFLRHRKLGISVVSRETQTGASPLTPGLTRLPSQAPSSGRGAPSASRKKAPPTPLGGPGPLNPEPNGAEGSPPDKIRGVHRKAYRTDFRESEVEEIVEEPLWAAEWPVAPLGKPRGERRKGASWSLGPRRYQVTAQSHRLGCSGALVVKVYARLLAEAEGEGRGATIDPRSIGWGSQAPGWKYEAIASAHRWALEATREVRGDPEQLSLPLEEGMEGEIRRWRGIPRGEVKDGRVEMNLATLARLGWGSGPALYRMIQLWRVLGRREGSLAEVFTRIGSCLKSRPSPTRARDVMNRGAEELHACGLLEAPLRITQRGPVREWCVCLRPDPQVDPVGAEKVVLRSALRLGLNRPVALEWLAKDPARLAEVVGGALLGVLRPQKTLGAMINRYLEGDYSVGSGPVRRIDLGANALRVRGDDDEAYLAWATLERERRQHRLGWHRTRETVEARLDQTFPIRSRWRRGRPPWMTGALRAMVLDDVVEMPGVTEWRKEPREVAA